MSFRAIIVDDEPLAREKLRRLVRSQDGLELVGECTDGNEAVQQIQELQPDLIFLDVQMPGLDGFQVLEALPEPLPAVVFVTAYDRFAVRAFEVHAVDYLLKPFDRDRFEVTLERVRARLNRTDRKAEAEIKALLADLKKQSAGDERLPVKSGGKIQLIPISDIDWIEAADNYAVLHAGSEKHWIRCTMGELEAKLARHRFVRASRSAIVNANRILELSPLFRGDFCIVLKSGAKVTLSRNYRANLDWLLK